MSRKAIVCACEDVSLSDLETAVARGHRDIESIKRYTGFGTGICQGKSCLSTVGRWLCDKKIQPAEAVSPFTPRPPLFPTELSLYASLPLEERQADAGGVPLALRISQPALKSKTPVRNRADIVIIGGGIMGLALAYNLAQRGIRDVVVLDKGYLCAGASGRNGGGVRMQWGTSTNIDLAKRSIDLMKRFARDLGINSWLRQGGYLFLARSAEVAQKLERSAKLHHQHGVHTQLLSPDAARDVVPELSYKGVHLCAYNPEDGVIFPWPFLWGYAQGATRLGVGLETFTSVTGFEVTGGRIRQVRTDRGDIACETVVLAAGAWSPEVARLLDVQLPNEPHRHEILSTEPLKPFLGPLVSVLDSGLYFSQSMRGEIVGGMGNPYEPAGLELGSSAGFLTRFARALTEQLPQAGHVKVLRQWAGAYDVTPDNNPILGRTPQLPNLLQMSGFVGHGFMMAPAVAERMAAWMAEGCGPGDDLFTRYSLDRFKSGKLEREDMIIG